LFPPNFDVRIRYISYVEIDSPGCENLGCRLFVRSAGKPLWLDHLPQIVPSEL
jgi:hypothetical protein